MHWSGNLLLTVELGIYVDYVYDTISIRLSFERSWCVRNIDTSIALLAPSLLCAV